MLGLVLAMAMFFSQIEYSEDFVCVPEAVFSPEFFLSTNNEDIPLDDILEKLDTVWAETEKRYQKQKYNPNISNLEYCILYALKHYSRYKTWVTSGYDFEYHPINSSPESLYHDIDSHFDLLEESDTEAKKHIQEYLDNFF